VTVPDPAGDGARTPGSKRLTNLQIRVLSSVVLAIVVLGLTWLGGLPFRLLSVIIAGAIFYEWTRMCRPNAAGSLPFLPEALMLVFLGALIAGLPATVLLVLVAGIVLVAAIAAILRKAPQWEAGGLAYAALSGFSLAYLRGGDHAGLIAILFLFAVVWATDILAYFVGRAIGGPKLAPSISPGKTWSGAVGGALGGLAAGLAIAAVTGWGGLWAAAVALLLAIVSQIGDLFESFVKRRNGVKDSSHIIPGHGGVMDRVDGLVAAAFTLYVIGVLFGSADNPASALVSG
jgi:phosphatidate cytidylyltransferase